MAERDDQIFLTLPSNNSVNYFPSNKISHYTTKLARPLQLDGAWTCGLVEIQYPCSWNKIYLKDCWLSYRSKTEIEGPHRLRFSIPDGYYDTGHDIINHFNKSTLEVGASLSIMKDPEGYVLLLIGRDGRKVHLSKNLARIFGFMKANEFTSSVKSDTKVDLDSNFHNIYIYTDIIENQLVGDTSAPLLRAIQVDLAKPFGTAVYKTFDNPYYIPVNKHYIDTVELGLYTELGQPVPFEFGHVLCKLHLRKVE
ncbi:hypothetical protein SNE40_014252 [Patella caerulea]|uniref:Uncharacterized protein n=1 Tax=Patella caerulea TaxID=87958 RepID=A0AAN8PSM6_PATCE